MPDSTVYPGNAAYVELPQGRYTFDAYAITLTTEKSDATDFNRVTAKWLPGASFGSVVLSGPFSTDQTATPQGLGLLSGNEYPIIFGLSEDIGVSLNIQVETCRITNRVSDVARVEVAGVVNSDFLSSNEIVFLFDVEDRQDNTEDE